MLQLPVINKDPMNPAYATLFGRIGLKAVLAEAVTWAC